jgi:nicotinamidase-related amidase
VANSRSPELLDIQSSALLVVDVQEKLAPLVMAPKRLVWNIRRLLDAAELFQVPRSATEQYPKGLGGTIAELAARLGPAPSKLRFSCAECESLFAQWRDAGRPKIVVTGMETHVCVQQTVLDLIHAGFRPYVVADAVSARGKVDHDMALRRMELSGATITTTESVLFEWCQASGTPEFKQISALVRETSPE